MSKKAAQKPNDQRSVVKNPNNRSHDKAHGNRGAQLNQDLEGSGETKKTGSPKQGQRSPNDQRSDVKNPNNPSHGKAHGNRGAQLNPNRGGSGGGKKRRK